MSNVTTIVGYEPATKVESDAALTVNDTAQPLTGVATKGSCFRSLRTNAETIYWGGAGVTSANGIPIYPGEAFSPGDFASDLALVYVVCEASKTAELRRVRIS